MNSIPAAVQQGVLTILQDRDRHAGLQSFQPLHGGCINPGGRLQTTAGVFFLKWNHAQSFPGMFAAEARGLQLLRDTDSLHIPDVIGQGQQGDYQFLLLEFIDAGRHAENYWTLFGQQLAQLHRSASQEFGLDHHNYVGSLAQCNTFNSSWIDFFINHRLQAQLTLGANAGRIDTMCIHAFEKLYHKLPSLLVSEPPALLHGDLWSGNVIATASGGPCLIDPAVYYGSREADLAMTQLFGGLDDTFLPHYDEVYPLQPGFRERFELYNLYPLLVHVNLFGGSYLAQVKSVLKRFVS